jgi:hypothetical protein
LRNEQILENEMGGAGRMGRNMVPAIWTRTVESVRTKATVPKCSSKTVPNARGDKMLNNHLPIIAEKAGMVVCRLINGIAIREDTDATGTTQRIRPTGVPRQKATS